MSSSYAPQNSNPNAGNQWLPSNQNQSSAAAGASLMLSAILSLVFVIIVITIHIYIRYRRQDESDGVVTVIHSRSHPTRLPVAAAPVSKGLDAATIEKLPTFPYRRPGSGGGAVECAVCLSAAEEGEMVRMLPGCKHLFHVGCIDMWLYSHSTCPVCRGEAKVVVTKFVYGEVEAVPPTLPERIGGGGGEAPEASSESQRRWVMIVDGEMDLERQ